MPLELETITGNELSRKQIRTVTKNSLDGVIEFHLEFDDNTTWVFSKSEMLKIVESIIDSFFMRF